MNKIFIVAFFAFLTLVQSNEPARQFVTAFLKSSTAKDVKLSDKCLGAAFDKSLEKVKKYIRSENVTLLLLTLQSMFSDIQKHCPLQNFIDLGTLIQKKLADQSIFDDIQNKLTDATKLLMKEYKSPVHTPTSVGTTSGGIVAVFIREKPKFLSFLEENRLGLTPFTVVEGVLLGLGKEEKSTKCHDDIVKHKDEIIKIIKELIEAIRTGTGLKEAIVQAIQKLFGMFEIVSDCRLFELSLVIQKLITPEGVAQLMERLKANIPNFILLGKDLITAFMKKDELGLGKPVGKALKIALDFYVN